MLLGYLEFAILLFLPGMALMELLGAGKHLSLVERLAIAFGLSMSVDVLVLLVGSSGLTLGAVRLRGISSLSLNAILGLSLVGIAVPAGIRRRVFFFSLVGGVTRADAIVLALTAAQFALVGVRFLKYPIFPEFQSVDFTQHVEIMKDLETGNISSLPGGILYYGIHLLMGSAAVLTGDEPLIVTQRSVAILASFCPLLVYSTARSLTYSSRASIIATAIYVFGGFIWFGSIFNAGLYANFYGFLAIFFLITSLSLLLTSRTPAAWTIFLVAVANAYFSHYSILTVIPTVLLLPVVDFIINRKVDRLEAVACLIPVVPALVALALRPDLVQFLISVVFSQSGSSITSPTVVSQAFAGIPVLQFVFAEITSDTSAIVLIAFAAFGVYLSIRERRSLLSVPMIWLFTVLVISPNGESAWRFAYVALVPISFIAAFGIGRMVHADDRQLTKKRRFKSGFSVSSSTRLGLVCVVVLLIFAGSWTYQLLSDAAANSQQNSRAEQLVYDSMQWMKSNIPQDGRVLSVTDWRYLFLGLIAERSAGYAPLITPDETYSQLGGSQDTYVVVTVVATVDVSNSSVNPFTAYEGDSRFQLVYQNDDVNVYKVLTRSS